MIKTLPFKDLLVMPPQCFRRLIFALVREINKIKADLTTVQKGLVCLPLFIPLSLPS